MGTLYIHSEAKYHDYFYSRKVRERIDDLNHFLGKDHQLHFFPEATIKKNKLPNGLLIKSNVNQTLLMPGFLRDPGCGFLLFKIDKFPRSSTALLSRQLMQFCHHFEEKRFKNSDLIISSIANGVRKIANQDLEQYSQPYFPMELECVYFDMDFSQLAEDLVKITNSIELKIVDDSENGSYVTLIGAIHTGSEYFPQKIQQHWFKPMIDCSLQHQFTNQALLEHGIFGLPDDMYIAQEYQQWVFAAMNFCIFKRWWIFNALRNFLKQKFDVHCSLINDLCHAGLFQEHNHLFQSRGVQILNSSTGPFYVAGQRESVSILLNKHANLPFVGHGTSYVSTKRNYEKHIGSDSEKYIQLMHNIHANTLLETRHCLAYNFNILMQKRHLESQGCIIRLLFPLFNYQGKYLRSVSG
jgi:hypothetical protein